MDNSEYDFRIQRAEIDKEDIKYFKQWNHCRSVLLQFHYTPNQHISFCEFSVDIRSHSGLATCRESSCGLCNCVAYYYLCSFFFWGAKSEVTRQNGHVIVTEFLKESLLVQFSDANIGESCRNHTYHLTLFSPPKPHHKLFLTFSNM
jgi:hypothetical protein